MMRVLAVLFLVLLCLSATACGKSSKQTASTTATTKQIILPPSKNPTDWALRVVEILMRPMNQDFNVVNGFSNPNVIVYIANQNPATLRIVKRRLNDLARCTQRMVAMGPPPKSKFALPKVYSQLKAACVTYVDLAQRLQKATLFMSSGRNDVFQQGRKLLREAAPINNKAAVQYAAAIKTAQAIPAFRKAGLQPSL